MFPFLTAAAAFQASPPNIIMALGDDTGWHGVGWHQSPACQADVNCAMITPHMDALLAEGVELDQHYTYRFCSPTRAALMTGRLPIHVNQENNAEWPWTAAAMHPSFRTVADVLRSKAGYATHQLGKVGICVCTVHCCVWIDNAHSPCQTHTHTLSLSLPLSPSLSPCFPSSLRTRMKTFSFILLHTCARSGISGSHGRNSLPRVEVLTPALAFSPEAKSTSLTPRERRHVKRASQTAHGNAPLISGTLKIPQLATMACTLRRFTRVRRSRLFTAQR